MTKLFETLLNTNIYLLLSLGFGFLSGISLSVTVFFWMRKNQRLELERQAQETLEKAQESAHQIDEELQMLQKDIEEEMWSKVADQLEQKEVHIKNLELRLEEFADVAAEKSARLDELVNKKTQILRQIEGRVEQRKQRTQNVKTDFTKKTEAWIQTLLPKSNSTKESLVESLKNDMIFKAQNEARENLNLQEQDLAQNLERDARRFLQIAINRFNRPYCPERGIGLVEFPNIENFNRFLSNERSLLKALEKACGVDVTVNPDYLSMSVLGFDPVRRELGRLTLEKLIHERELNEKRIQDITEKTKRDLFKKIKADGDRIVRELRIENMHPEVKNMMGALRYRYSYAQNQHFHCAEVGWLCGLLSAELGLPIKDGRRAGMLHDLGKAMDHSREGGHAVIGADFIEKHGEKPEIVHAVRAHHFDEQPQTELAYLVIAADAISGARPGARRSTIDSYTQKMADLENIGRSFDGVLDTFILSAGREVRILVDSERVDDQRALTLSKEIAQKIEEECSYPGLIKVTVVRQTMAVEMAK